MDFTFLYTFGIIVATIFLIIYLYYKNEYQYWKRLGFPYIKPKFPFGNLSNHFLKNQPFFELLTEYYTIMKENKSRYMGLYFFSRKQMLISDLKLIKNILTTDFQYFSDRGAYYDAENDPLSAHLVVLGGEQWKNIRVKLTPTFSSGKLKNMIPIVVTQGEELVKLLQNEETIDIKELVARYTTDVIGSCAFGIDCNSLKNPEAKFRKIGKRVFEESLFDILRRIFFRSFPSLGKLLKMKVLNTEVSEFFMNSFIDNINYRRANNIKRNDFLHLLNELIDREDPIKMSLTMNEAAAQAFVFFLAGFETSATTITFALYELAENVIVQEKLRNEIQEAYKNTNKISYEIMELDYLDKVVRETLRKWPTVPFLIRHCVQDYKIPESHHTIPKGMFVFIPTWGIHRDPEIYSNPLDFDPERFSDSLKSTRGDYTYLPFGNGPRICIGLRFAMMQVKVALVMMLQKYKFSLNNKTITPFTFTKNPTTLGIKNTVWLNVTPIK